MRILHVYHIYPALFGGASTVVYQITKELCKRGHVADVLTTDAYFTGEENHEEGVNVYRFALVSQLFSKKNLIMPNMKFVLWLKQMLKTYDCIHIHGHRNIYTPFVCYYAKKYVVPYLLHVHGSFRSVLNKRRVKRIYDRLYGYKLLRDASLVVALNHVEAEQYNRIGVPEEKIAIIPNGIDLTDYVDLPPKGSFKRKLGIPEDRKIILYLGRIHTTKGIDFLVKAYAYLTKKLACKDAVLVIAGPDDGYLNELKSIVSSLGISNSVLFTGSVSRKDKISAYVDSHIVVNVEPVNVYGLVPLEAAACSTPVIVSSTNAVSEIVLKGKFGFSVKYGDVNELAMIMEKMLNNENLLVDMGKKGRKFVFENYDWANIISELENVYAEIVRNQHSLAV